MKKTLTLAATIEKLGKDIARMEKKVAIMRKKVAAAIKKHQTLQERIARLETEGRIVSMQKDAEIVAGENCWYVKADSLNTNPDAQWNWYYEVKFYGEHGYDCTCESLKPCKHITKLSASFAPVSTIVTLQMGNVTLSEPIANLHNAVAHEIWTRRVLAEVREDPAEKAEREARLQREAEEMVADAHNKYDVQPTEDERAEAEAVSQHLQAELTLYQAEQYTKAIESAPLNGRGGFSLLRV